MRHFPPLVHSLEGWNRPELSPGSSIWILHKKFKSKNSSNWVIYLLLPKCTGRKLDLKQSSQDSNQHSDSGQQGAAPPAAQHLSLEFCLQIRNKRGCVLLNSPKEDSSSTYCHENSVLQSPFWEQLLFLERPIFQMKMSFIRKFKNSSFNKRKGKTTTGSWTSLSLI